MNPFEMMKNLQQMQEQMKEAQARIQRVRVEGRAGGDLVRVLMDGTFQVLGVTILPEAAGQSDVALLQELVRAACADAHNKAKEAIAQEMGSLSAAMPLLNQMMGR